MTHTLILLAHDSSDPHWRALTERCAEPAGESVRS
ncbi:hypothetical protein FHR95_003023 [Halomonas fontilapidosi]|uniref:Uncharacterized protein n=1 Tax=Halomonas fontilapidosi TaxID=616675 RepID=A0A7W5DM48_9GAMM|nr:hypothetical protein [Halomonas fontilapidosi]